MQAGERTSHLFRLANLDGVEGTQEEYYTAAGAYTATFWPVDPKVAQQKAFELHWVSVKAFQDWDKVKMVELSLEKAGNLKEPQKFELPKFGP